MDRTEPIRQEMVETIHFLYSKGWAPATSSNYSFRLPDESSFYISTSGIDKGKFNKSDFMPVDRHGVAWEEHRKPSAETLLHCLIYERLPEVHCILHTHTVYNTLVSMYLSDQRKMELYGYEILKGISGITTHQTYVEIPIFENSQDMKALTSMIADYWDHHSMVGFLLAGHGLYTWGKTVAEAKRHLETLEFLMECEYKLFQLPLKKRESTFFI